MMNDKKRPSVTLVGVDWMDVLWLVLLAVLAILPPIREVHKQMALLAFGILQLGERSLIERIPRQPLARDPARESKIVLDPRAAPRLSSWSFRLQHQGFQSL